jgi:hypothetical protein
LGGVAVVRADAATVTSNMRANNKKPLINSLIMNLFGLIQDNRQCRMSLDGDVKSGKFEEPFNQTTR